MIHIILAILKIVGILLAVLLGLVLLILLTVLFLPLRYRICAEKHGELKKSTANVSVSWLFGILKVKAGYRNGQISFVPQIFGKKIDFAKKNTGQTEDSSEKAENNETKNCETEKTEDVSEEKKALPVLEEKTKPDPEPSPKTETQENKASKSETQDGEMSELQAEDAAEPEKRHRFFNIIEKVRMQIEKIRNRILTAKEQAKKTIRSITKSKETLKRYLDFLRSDLSREVYQILKNHLFYLLRHIRPHKIKGYVHYGFGDPALTGEFTGILYLILPAKCGELDLDPDFEDQVCEGEVLALGHIRICHLALTGAKIFFDKKLKIYWKRFCKFQRIWIAIFRETDQAASHQLIAGTLPGIITIIIYRAVIICKLCPHIKQLFVKTGRRVISMQIRYCIPHLCRMFIEISVIFRQICPKSFVGIRMILCIINHTI